MKVLACIKDDSAARAVLEIARSLAHTLRAETEALHVRKDGTAAIEDLARDVGIALRVEHGDPVSAIVRALAQDDVELAVIGARSAGGGKPAGRVALAVAAGASKPVVGVPPNLGACAPGGLKRLLLPLNGTPDAALAVAATSRVFAGSAVEVVALHVFDQSHAPLFLDRPEHDLEVWAREFLARHCGDQSARLEIRTGETGKRVLDVADTERVDMIALAWSQDLSAGHAAVVRRVLAGACVPVMLVPVSDKVASTTGHFAADAT